MYKTALHQNSFKSLIKPTISLNLLCCLLFFINVFISLTIWIFKRILKYNLTNPHFVRLLLLCYNIQGGTGGVSFANKNVSGLQKYLIKISK